MSEISASFSVVAEDYQRYRPGYPAELYEILQERCLVEVGTRVLDVACGTGNVTRELAKIYPQVCGIELSEGMLEQAQQIVTSLPIGWVNGVVEQLPFKARAFDLITVAQALHWFDVDAFLCEATRVLKPGGMIAIFAEGAASGEVYRAKVREIVQQHAKEKGAEPKKRRTVNRKRVDENLSAHGFRDVARLVIEYELTWTMDRFIGFMHSTSQMAQFDLAERERLSLAFREALKEPTDGEDEFVEKNTTVLYVGYINV